MRLQKFSGLLKNPENPEKSKLLLVRRVSGGSMLPAYKPRQLVVGLIKWRYLRPGDVVIVQHDGLEKIKRISLMHVDKIFVLGDNGDASTDSRQFGWLKTSQVTAKVVWPHSTRMSITHRNLE